MGLRPFIYISTEEMLVIGKSIKLLVDIQFRNILPFRLHEIEKVVLASVSKPREWRNIFDVNCVVFDLLHNQFRPSAGRC
jgi:hypothetical protein